MNIFKLPMFVYIGLALAFVFKYARVQPYLHQEVPNPGKLSL